MPSTNRIQEDASVASRYLAGQLSTTEQAAYEQHFIDDPEAVQELEATARMKVGLANLRDTGQLEPVLRSVRHTPRLTVAFATAASVVLAIIGLALWRGNSVPDESILFATSSALLEHSGEALALGAHYALLRTRASDHDALVALPAVPKAIELRVRPEAEASDYRATLSKIREGGSVVQIASVGGLRAESDRFVRLYVDSSELSPGLYLLVLSATDEQRGDAAMSSFRIKVIRSDNVH